MTECQICYKYISGYSSYYFDEKDKCLTKHPCCKDCIGTFQHVCFTKGQESFCPVCRQYISIYPSRCNRVNGRLFFFMSIIQKMKTNGYTLISTRDQDHLIKLKELILSKQDCLDIDETIIDIYLRLICFILNLDYIFKNKIIGFMPLLNTLKFGIKILEGFVHDDVMYALSKTATTSDSIPIECFKKCHKILNVIFEH